MIRVPRQSIASVWDSLHEPRAVTATIVTLGYVMAIALGVMVALTPSPWASPAAGTFIQVSAIIALVGGGVLGVPTAWRGSRALERGAALMVALGVGLVIIELAVYAYLNHVPLSELGLAMSVMALGLWVTRFLRVRTATWAPGRGPLTTAQRDAVHHIIDQDDADRAA